MSVHPVRYLVLWLTTACNLRCAYCYRGEQQPASMPLRTALAALRLAGASGLPFHVQLAGGEPTLEPALIEAIGKSVRDARWPATLGLQTNGTLLDPGLAAVCKDYGINVNVSLDGPPAVHEHIRGNAKGTFRGLALLAQSELPVRVTTVLSAANADSLGGLVLSLAAFGNVEGVALSPVVLKGRALAMGTAAPSPAAVRAGTAEMLSTLELVNRFRPGPIRWREYAAVWNVLKGKEKAHAFCHACLGESLAVHPDGTVYPCGQTIGDRRLSAGDLDSINWEKLHGMYRETRLRGSCAECALNGRCPGECPSRLRYNSGEPENAMCIIYRTLAAAIHEEENS